MPTQSFVIAEDLEHFITAGVRAGRFRDANEAVSEGLRLLEQRDRAQTTVLSDEIQKGIDALERGEFKDFESVDALCDYVDERALQAAARVNARKRVA